VKEGLVMLEEDKECSELLKMVVVAYIGKW